MLPQRRRAGLPSRSVPPAPLLRCPGLGRAAGCMLLVLGTLQPALCMALSPCPVPCPCPGSAAWVPAQGPTAGVGCLGAADLRHLLQPRGHVPLGLEGSALSWSAASICQGLVPHGSVSAGVSSLCPQLPGCSCSPASPRAVLNAGLAARCLQTGPSAEQHPEWSRVGTAAVPGESPACNQTSASARSWSSSSSAGRSWRGEAEQLSRHGSDFFPGAPPWT